MKEKLKEIVEHYGKAHKSGLNLRNFDCRESNKPVFSDFKDDIRQISMFKEKKLAIITNVFSDADFRERFLKEAEKFLQSGDIILFYEPGEIDKRGKLFKFLKKNAECQEFEPLSGQKLKNWVKKEFGKREVKINQEALETLCEYVGGDLWRMSNEIRKLASFRREGAVGTEDVRALIKPKIETDIFKTIDAVSQKNKKRALELLHKHLEKGDSPLYLLTMINYQFRNILIVKDFIERRRPYGVILKKSGLHPFVARKSYFQSQKFSFPELKKIYRNIFQADLDIKTGRINPETALDLLIAEI
jgi:DNA polymerase-3 subunit delta